MATIEQLVGALEKADAAGNTEDAQAIADMIKEARAQQQDSSSSDFVGRRRSFKDISSSIKARDKTEQLFDTKSGIQNAALRAALSGAETSAEEEKQLKELYGLGEGDYTRDRRGRLAITKQGGTKLGLDLKKDTLIDEEGFSRYDFADLAGILPELSGSVGGAIAGAPLGLLGIIGGSVLGAMGGAAAEEGVEALAGVSTQTAGEIAKDIAVEGGITLVGDVTFGAAGLLFRAGRKGLSAKPLPDEDLTAAGEALTYKIKDPTTGEMIDVPITPELGAVGAPSIIARQSKIMEKVIGSSDRLKNNYDNMQKILDDFRTRAAPIKGVDQEEAGEAVLEGVFQASKGLQAAEKTARESVVKTLVGATDQFMNAAMKGADVDEAAFKILSDTSKNFDTLAASKFSEIENLVGTVTGSKEFIDTVALKEIATRLEKENAGAIAAARSTSEGRRESAAADYAAIIDGIKGIGAYKRGGNKTGFLQLYNLRKTLNDGKMATGSTSGQREMQKVIDEIDRMLDPKMLETYAQQAGAKSIGPEGLDQLKQASESLNQARGFFKRGQTAIDNLQDAIRIKDLQKIARDGTIPANLDFMTALVKNGKPESLKRAITVVKDFGSKEQSEQLRGLLATRWLENAMQKTLPDGAEAGMFSGKAFAKSITDLGKTADTLFGSNVGQIRALAKQIEKSSSANMTEDAILKAVQEGGGAQGGIAGVLRAVKTAQDDLNNFVTNRTLKELNTGRLSDNPLGAAEYIANPKAQPQIIGSVIDVFKKQGDTESLDKIRSYYMNNVLRDFGGDTFVDGNAIKNFSKSFNEAASGGKFRKIFGEEMGKDMEKFGRVLAINAKSAQGGDLVAANIAASPLNNLGKIAKYGIFTRFLTSAPYYKQVLDQYKISTEGLPPKKKAEILGRIMSQLMTQLPGQLAQEGYNTAENQISAVMANSGLDQQLSQIQSRMNPPVSASGIGQVNVTQPLAPNTQPVGGPPANVANIRQQAAQNPAIAQALGINPATATLLGTGQP